ARLARGNERASSRARARPRWRPRFGGESSGPLFVVVEEAAELGQLLAGGAAGGERAQHEASGGSVEGAVEEIAGELTLGPFARAGRVIDVGAGGLIAADEAL